VNADRAPQLKAGVMLLSDAMNELPRIEAEVTFLPESEGGRKEPPQLLSGGQYRPHLVVGDPNQRQAVTIRNEIQETYLGVAFVSSPSNIESGKSFPTELVLMYWPHPMYESLVPGVTFTMREGARIVGYGQVKRILMNGAA
jgi:translation elongation factor EF-Tu-like GTPase